MSTSDKPRPIPYSIELSFRYHQNLMKRDSLRMLNQIFEGENLQPSVQSRPGIITASSLDEILESNYFDYEAKGETFGNKLRTVGFPLLFQSQELCNAWCSFSWSVFKGERVQMNLSASILAMPGEQHKAYNTLAAIFQSFAGKLYEATHPISGYVLDPNADSRAWNRVGTAKLKLVTLTWLNYWGPEIVQKYDREILSNIPGYFVKHLTDGGILYQSRPSISIGNEIAHRRWQQDVISYLSSHGIKITFERE